MRIHVGGDGSFMALVDCTRYKSFVGDWTADSQLTRHLLAESNQRTLLFWETGFESDWLFEVSAGITSRTGFREFVGYIECSSGALHLVNYDSLTMAAQFDDHRLPDKETAGYRLDLPNGLYQIRVVQMVDPEEPWWETLGDNPAFLLEYEAFNGNPPAVDALPWVESL